MQPEPADFLGGVLGVTCHRAPLGGARVARTPIRAIAPDVPTGGGTSARTVESRGYRTFPDLSVPSDGDVPTYGEWYRRPQIENLSPEPGLELNGRPRMGSERR